MGTQEKAWGHGSRNGDIGEGMRTWEKWGHGRRHGDTGEGVGTQEKA